MSTIDTSTWSPDSDLNVDIGGIQLNSDAPIQQTWQAIQMLMAALKGDTNDIKLTINQPDGTTIVATNQTLTVVDNGHAHTIANVSGLQTALDGKAADADMSGATASADGASGLVPQPLAGDQDKLLKGDGTWGTLGASDIPSLDASKITSGTIDIARLPAGALERLVTVADQTARYALTTADVQLGDTVKEADTSLLYFVVDTANLDNASGYEVYTAGAATAVPWSGVTGKPSTFTPSSHEQASNTINAMTGYSKPNSGSAIVSGDSLNAAIGKLEYKVDSTCVHVSGNETVDGIKYFGDIIIKYTNQITLDYNVGSSYIEQEILRFHNKAINQMIAYLYFGRYSGGNNTFCMRTKNSDETMWGDLGISCEPSNGYVKAFVQCGNGGTTMSPDNSNDSTLATTKWVRRFCETVKNFALDTKVVHTDNDESVYGVKSFYSVLRRAFNSINLDYDVGSSGYEERSLSDIYNPSLSQNVMQIIWGRYNNSLNAVRIRTFTQLVNNEHIRGDLCLFCSNSGYVYASVDCGSGGSYLSPDNSNDATLATTKWVRRYCETTKDFLTSLSANSIYLSQAAAISDYLTKTDASSTYVTITNADSNYFRNAGTNTLTSFHVFHRNVETSGLLFGGGASTESGAHIVLYGPASSNNAGRVFIRAKTSSTNVKSLVLSPDGSATWDGQTIQTSSDERIKTPISGISDDILDAWGRVQWGEFKFLDAVKEKGENARYHIGLIAQSVDRIFKSRGADILKYGILCHEEREASEIEPAEDLWMIRYTEALCMEAAYQRRRADRLEARIKALEEKLNG